MVSYLEHPTLKLNKGWQAIGSTIAREAICDVMGETAWAVDPKDYSVHTWESWVSRPINVEGPIIRTSMGPIEAPEVIVLRQYNRPPHDRVAYNRKNLYRRDNYRCQYCGRKPDADDWTIDHVIPKSLGGKLCWENTVLACTRCNKRKDNRTLAQANMHLVRPKRVHGKIVLVQYDRPKAPAWNPIYTTRRVRLPASWAQFIQNAIDDLYWETELED
jgi:hypothetical protein